MRSHAVSAVLLYLIHEAPAELLAEKALCQPRIDRRYPMRAEVVDKAACTEAATQCPDAIAAAIPRLANIQTSCFLYGLGQAPDCNPGSVVSGWARVDEVGGTLPVMTVPDSYRDCYVVPSCDTFDCTDLQKNPVVEDCVECDGGPTCTVLSNGCTAGSTRNRQTCCIIP
eukprot:Hpha_TRINITY_DN20787_c0_g1::TRINITY_DN20787_c0_g1_i1::g.33432::m.33432